MDWPLAPRLSPLIINASAIDRDRVAVVVVEEVIDSDWDYVEHK